MNGLALRTVEENDTSEITLWGYGITDQRVLPIVEAIREKMRGLQLIERLCLSANSVGNTGSQALATLLEDPIYCKLHTLQLQGNQIDNDGVSFLVNSLANNTKLKVLWLHNNPILDRSLIEGIFCKLLCNTSSVNSIYLSNHTLEDVSLPKNLQQINSQLHMAEIPGEMGSLLQLNKDSNTSVAIRKIMRYYPCIDMSPLFGWDAEDEWTLKGLPYVINWFERANVVSSIEHGEDCSTRKLSSMYQFTLAMPLLFVPAAYTKAGDKKRKRESR